METQVRYFNRELSWLKFNHRVLDQSQNEDLPLLERLKFIAIYGINLDEFYMIRIAGLKRLYQKGIVKVGSDGMSPLMQLQAIEKTLRTQKKELEKAYFNLRDSLFVKGFKILSFADLDKSNQQKAKSYFFENLYPVIVPIVVDSIHPFPHLNNLSFGIILKLRKKDQNNHESFALVRIPRFFPRFIEIQEGIFVLCESIVGEFIECIFEGFEVLAWCPFRVTRNADFEIEEEEADDFIELLNEGLKARRKGEIVRLQVGRSKDKSLLQFLQMHLGVGVEDIFEYDLPLNLGALWQIISHPNYAHLHLEHFSAKPSKRFNPNLSLLENIEKEDILMFHPFESFDPVVELISEASKDPQVISIKMTLYRVGKNSPIVQALLEAAENKQVSVLVELKARFDEENNLGWVRALEDAGVHVVYGAVGLKVHAKIALILRKEQERVAGFVHISTGNYNIQSAKIYTDISLLSSKQEIVADSIKFFHSLFAGLSNQTHLNTLLMAPSQIKPSILSLIRGEREKGERGEIIMKMNALVDSEVIEELYQASNAGVQISLIVRGICALKPRVKGMSENICVISIVGKYLEHARIYYFKHGGMYFGSADMMPRNLERRVELLVPIYEERYQQELLGILHTQLKSSVGVYELNSSGEYQKTLANGIDCQKEFESLRF